ncbi:uncharacterized protein LOC122363277 isoform X2 [Amphibalanus amphitrite]|uniref:uncharacterized protein LOC122363277 isoform X2 n=1 Tax=Amphibalanus amphitrite TaxID=1232801 RepID=UPI001C91D21C|nr:uncharacterized protein LOC122363277 isoform X2 [Amphibalanus amphitrite]
MERERKRPLHRGELRGGKERQLQSVDRRTNVKNMKTEMLKEILVLHTSILQQRSYAQLKSQTIKVLPEVPGATDVTLKRVTGKLSGMSGFNSTSMRRLCPTVFDFLSAVCLHCGQPATSLCLDCDKTFSCESCDVNEHQWKPLHRRLAWTQGYLMPLKPQEAVTETGELVKKACSIPLQCCSSCDICGGSFDLRGISTSDIIVITERGRLDLNLPVWVCEACNNRQNPLDADFMASGYFRGTPCHTSTIFSLEVFHLWRNLKSLSPGTSLAAFAMSLEKMGQLGGTCAPVDPERFQKAYSEWSYMVFEARRVVGHEDFQCHACGPKPMCVHVDGNGKLYRFKSAGGDTDRRPYHDGSCIASKEDVDAHVERLASIGKV